MSNSSTSPPANCKNARTRASMTGKILKENSKKRTQADMSTSDAINCKRPSLVSGIARFYNSEEFSDMKIKCQGHTFFCHRIVICSQSKPLAAHLSEGFPEAETGVIELVDDNKSTVELLLKYLYSGNYTVSPEITITKPAAGSIPESDHAQEILAHTSVYIMAEKFDLPGLKIVAARKYQTSFPRDLRSTSVLKAFIDTLRKMYTETPENDRTLKDAAVELAYSHAPILDKASAFNELCRGLPSLSFDLYKRSRLSTLQETEQPAKKKRMSEEVWCPACSRKVISDLTVSAAAKKKGKYHCGDCLGYFG